MAYIIKWPVTSVTAREDTQGDPNCGSESFGIISWEDSDMMPKKKARRCAQPPQAIVTKHARRWKTKAEAAETARIHQNIFESEWREKAVGAPN